MRLICPNCGAQYEVADDVIPEAGRDVQCSNCGHTWFETPGASEARELGEAEEIAAEEAEAEPAPEPQNAPDAEPEDAPTEEVEPETASGPEPEPEPETEPETEEAPAAPDRPERQELDPEVADILRSEAEFEQARRAEDAGLETQPDLGLTQNPDEDRRGREARDRLARLRGEPEVAAEEDSVETDAPRRELLPDIEEINSTLRPDASPVEAAEMEAMASTRSGFRRGFVLMVFLALIAVALYVFAPQIMAALPPAEGVMTAYVEWVDGMRIWLDQKVEGFIESSGSAEAEAPSEG